MKQPKLRNLKLDLKESASIRARIKKQSKIKITINVDSDTLEAVRSDALRSGVPYQRLLNSLLRKAVSKSEPMETRLARIEREIKLIKGKLAA